MGHSTKDILVPHDQIRDPNKITDVNERVFKENGLDMHHHEVDKLEDDHRRGVRRYKVRGPRTFIDLGRKSHR